MAPLQMGAQLSMNYYFMEMVAFGDILKSWLDFGGYRKAIPDRKSNVHKDPASGKVCV